MGAMSTDTLYRTTPSRTSYQQRFETVLRETGHSLTRPRRLVFLTLLSGPITPTQLSRALMNETDRASVYRSIALFERLGMVNRFRHTNQDYLELSEVFNPHHHHAVCQQCGSVLDITSPELETLLGQIAKAHGFLAVEHNLGLSGYCGECQGS